MRLTKWVMAPIWAATSLAGGSAYPDEPAAKEPPAVESTAAPVSAATTSPAAATPAPPPVDRKKALEFGFRPGVVKGIPVFCKEVPIEGTRFTNKRCVPETQFSAYLSLLQTARDAAMKNGCYGGICGNMDGISAKPRMGMGSK